MSQENVELVRLAHERLNRGDIEALVELCDPNFRIDMSERIFNPETYERHDGIRRFYADVRDIWEQYRWTPEELLDAPPHVVALVRAQGRGRGSGLEIDRRIALVWTLSRGRATAVRLYVDPTKALDVGLSEQPASRHHSREWRTFTRPEVALLQPRCSGPR
jgi:ketosteroid isomerase-like protein